MDAKYVANFQNRLSTAREFLGIIKGIICDNIVTEKEMDFLKEKVRDLAWENNLVKPFDIIYDRIKQIYADGRVDKKECEDMYDLLSSIVNAIENTKEEPEYTSTSPEYLDNPQPKCISFGGKRFCLTGIFAFGPRRECTIATVNSGGDVSEYITLKTDYLVVGSICNPEWKTTKAGLKILRAIEMRSDPRSHLQIISEDLWARCLER